VTGCYVRADLTVQLRQRTTIHVEQQGGKLSLRPACSCPMAAGHTGITGQPARPVLRKRPHRTTWLLRPANRTRRPERRWSIHRSRQSLTVSHYYR